MIFKLPISISISPNTGRDDYLTVIKTLPKPGIWLEGPQLKKAKVKLESLTGLKNTFLFNSGRSSLLAILDAFNIGKGDEVLLQAFTCVAVADPIIWVGAKPVFVDTDETLNINPDLLEKKISAKTKAIIVQHTFGIPAGIEKIRLISKKHGILLIEDCAHSLGASINGKKIGTFGDASFFSFGRDKIVSSVFGGMAYIRPEYTTENVKLEKYYSELSYPGYFWIFQQLLHPLAFMFILPFYNLIIGKIFLLALQKIRLLSKPIYNEEKFGGKPDIFPRKYPNALACLLVTQLNKIDQLNGKRISIAKYYSEKLKNLKGIKLPEYNREAVYLRFNILTVSSDIIISQAKKMGIGLGNWYKNTIDPRGVEFYQIGYVKGSCPQAEKQAGLSVNLPTYCRLTENDLEYIISVVQKICR